MQLWHSSHVKQTQAATVLAAGQSSCHRHVPSGARSRVLCAFGESLLWLQSNRALHLHPDHALSWPATLVHCQAPHVFERCRHEVLPRSRISRTIIECNLTFLVLPCTPADCMPTPQSWRPTSKYQIKRWQNLSSTLRATARTWTRSRR
jgi:hypothetical protein